MSNTHVERLLARMKASCAEQRPHIERLVCTSFLTQWLHKHKRAGGLDPCSGQQRSTLLRRQVPLRAGKSRRAARSAGRKQPRGTLGVCRYVILRATKQKLPRAARDEERRRLFAEFRELSPEERRAFAASGRRPVQCEPGISSADAYASNIGDDLFGLSSEET